MTINDYRKVGYTMGSLNTFNICQFILTLFDQSRDRKWPLFWDGKL